MTRENNKMSRKESDEINQLMYLKRYYINNFNLHEH